MTQVSVSVFRQNLPNFINKVFNGEEFLIAKNGLVVALLTPVKKIKKKTKKKIIIPQAFGMWKDLKKSSMAIVNQWRKENWKGKYGD